RQNHLVVFALAAAIGAYVNNKKAINLNPILGFIALFLSLAAVGFSLNVANNQFKGEQWSQKMVAAYTKRNIQQMQALYATQDFKYYNLDRTTVPLPYFAGMASLASNNPADATFYFQQALQIHPNHLLTVNN